MTEHDFDVAQQQHDAAITSFYRTFTIRDFLNSTAEKREQAITTTRRCCEQIEQLLAGVDNDRQRTFLAFLAKTLLENIKILGNTQSSNLLFAEALLFISSHCYAFRNNFLLEQSE